MISFGDKEKVLDSKVCPPLVTLFFITGHGLAINFASSPPTSFCHQQRYRANTLLILLSVFNFLS
jgi:hypothetical protein